MALANSCVISLFCLPINSQSLQLHDSPLPSSESPSGGSKDLSSPLRNRTEQGNFFFLFFSFSQNNIVNTSNTQECIVSANGFATQR